MQARLMMKHQLSAVNLCVLVVICVTVLLQLVSCLDPPRFQVSALPQNVYRYGTFDGNVLSSASMGCIATVMDLNYFQSRWFAKTPDGSETQLNSSDARILIREGLVISPNHQGTNAIINNLSYLDNGTYRCEIQENDVSSQPISEWASATIELVLEVRLESVDINGLVRTFNDSQFVELGCEMSGYIRPDNDLYWIVNGVPLDLTANDGSKYRVSYRNGSNVSQFGGSSTIPSRVVVLTILDVNLADSGAYSCAINNTELINQSRLEVMPASKPSGYPQGVTVKPISSTAIEISWNEVPMMEQNGNITHYEILYTPVNSLLEQQPKVSTTGGPTLISLLQGLEEYTIYSVSVRAVTIVGSGPLSPPQMNRTFEDIPSAAPRNLAITSLDKNSLQVSWERPDPNDINGVLRLYKVEYCSPIRGIGNVFIATNCTQLDVNGNDNGVLLTSLKEGTVYTVSVAAFTVGVGPAAQDVARTREAQLPLQPPPGEGTIAGIVIGVLLAILAVVVIASVVIGVIIRIKLSKRQHKQVPSMAVESQAVSVGESARAQSPNLVPVPVSSENGVLDPAYVGEELTEPITSNGLLKEPTATAEEEPLNVSIQPKLELTELLKDEPPQYSLFDPTPSESPDPAAQEESDAMAKLNFDDGAVGSAHKDDIDSPLSMDAEQSNDTKDDLMELLQNDDQDSS